MARYESGERVQDPLAGTTEDAEIYYIPTSVAVECSTAADNMYWRALSSCWAGEKGEDLKYV